MTCAHRLPAATPPSNPRTFVLQKSQIAKRIREPAHRDNLDRPQPQPATADEPSLGSARRGNQPQVCVRVGPDGREVGPRGGGIAAVGRDPSTIEKSWFGNMLIEPDAARLEARLAKRAARGHGDAYGLNAMVGTPEQIESKLREYVAVGVTHFIAMFGRVERLGATELFANEVIPRFR